ncbi:MAG TPA: hypothetical protein VEV43_04270, partial [Actinomycetota bacterium]|nr:hypothetical protein [Actinomycetota bacterium]
MARPLSRPQLRSNQRKAFLWLRTYRPMHAPGCTTDLLVALLSAEGGTEYPIVERTPEGSIVIHPQNIEPAVGETADRLVNAPGSIVTAVGTWVDCVV